MRLQNYDVIKPIWFLHVPKTGSSIINTLIGYVDPGWVASERVKKPPFAEPFEWKESACDGNQTCGD
eukprot:15477762-Alexandrium_andersonii.AAC.1